MAEITIPIEKKAKKLGRTTVSGGGDVVVKDSANADKKAVGARDYATSKGYSGVVDWDGENVLVGGQALKPERVTNGIAYVPQSDMDRAIGDFEKRNGIIGSDGVLDMYDKKYSGSISGSLKKLTDRSEFNYKPEDDPAYQAYKEQYERLAQDAYRRVLNDNNTSAQGASGAVLSEALASRDEYLRELTDIIPELERTAYDRYEGETQRLRDNLDDITDIADEYYRRLYTADRDAVSDAVNAGEAEREEKQRWIDNELAYEESERERIMDSYELAQLAQEIEYYPDKMNAELEGKRLGNEETALENAAARGFFTAADEYSLPWLAQFRTDYGYSIDPNTALVALEYDKAYAKQRGTINAKMGW